MGSKRNDKTLSVVNHRRFGLKGSKLGLHLKEQCQANGFNSTLLEHFFNNSLVTTFVSSYLLTSGLATEYQSWQEILKTIQACISS